MKILFLDQTGILGGAEFSLVDVAYAYRENCLVGLFEDGPFKTLLEQKQIPVQVLNSQPIAVRRDSNVIQSLGNLAQIIPLIIRVIQKARDFDVIYANTQKALVIGAIASWLSQRPFVYHLRDILSLEHFSQTNQRLAVLLANRFASIVIANSQATKAAFIKAGGRAELVEVVYNGFQIEQERNFTDNRAKIRQQYHLTNQFVVGHFSRLSPWKGQHILLEALAHCPEKVVAVFVGDALFGEEEYVQQLHQQVNRLGLNNRVRFLGFRSDISQLMTACDLIAHTSTAPEPFGRVIIEAMLCEKPVVAAAAGGAIELVEHSKTGWLTPPGDILKLAEVVNQCVNQPQQAAEIAKAAKVQASKRFNLSVIQQQIDRLLNQAVSTK